MTRYAYTREWNILTGAPVLGSRWYTEHEARTVYEEFGPLEVVGVVAPGAEEDSVVIDFVIGFGYGAASPYVRVQWLSPNQSIVQLTDFQLIEGRLFRKKVIEYAYPDDSRPYPQALCTAMRTLFVKPDGTGIIRIEDSEEGTGQEAEVKDYPVDDLWVDMPGFGQWELLTDPHLGFRTQEV